MLRMIEGVDFPVLIYSFAAEMKNVRERGIKLDSKYEAAMANGFFVRQLDVNMVEFLRTVPIQDPKLLDEYVGKNVIMADIDMMTEGRLTEEEWMAMLHHEQGHLVYKHLERHVQKHGVPTSCEIMDDVDHEMQADAYACLFHDREVVKSALKKTIRAFVGRATRKPWKRFIGIVTIMMSEGYRTRMNNLRPDAA